MKYAALSLALILFAPIAISQVEKHPIQQWIEEQEAKKKAAEAERQAALYREAVIRMLAAAAAGPAQREPDINFYDFSSGPYLPHLYQRPQRITPFTCSRVGNFVNCY